MKLSRQQLCLIAPVLILFVVNIAFYMTAVQRKYDENEKLQKTYMMLRSRPETSAMPPGYGPHMAVMKAIDMFYDRIPGMIDFPDQAGRINRVIEESNLSSGKIVFKSRPLREHDLWVYSASLTLTGSYANAKKLLADIQSLPLLCCVESLNVRALEEDENLIKMDLGIALYCKL